MLIIDNHLSQAVFNKQYISEKYENRPLTRRLPATLYRNSSLTH